MSQVININNSDNNIDNRDLNNLLVDDKIITINVGGTLYTTYQSTVSNPINNKEHLLSLIFKNENQIPITKDYNNNIFIDRNGTLFSFILDYLRVNGNTNKIAFPLNDAYLMEQLENEIEFFQLDDLYELLKGRRKSFKIERKNKNVTEMMLNSNEQLKLNELIPTTTNQLLLTSALPTMGTNNITTLGSSSSSNNNNLGNVTTDKLDDTKDKKDKKKKKEKTEKQKKKKEELLPLDTSTSNSLQNNNLTNTDTKKEKEEKKKKKEKKSKDKNKKEENQKESSSIVNNHGIVNITSPTTPTLLIGGDDILLTDDVTTFDKKQPSSRTMTPVNNNLLNSNLTILTENVNLNNNILKTNSSTSATTPSSDIMNNNNNNTLQLINKEQQQEQQENNLTKSLLNNKNQTILENYFSDNELDAYPNSNFGEESENTESLLLSEEEDDLDSQDSTFVLQMKSNNYHKHLTNYLLQLQNNNSQNGNNKEEDNKVKGNIYFSKNHKIKYIVNSNSNEPIIGYSKDASTVYIFPNISRYYYPLICKQPLQLKNVDKRFTKCHNYYEISIHSEFEDKIDFINYNLPGIVVAIMSNKNIKVLKEHHMKDLPIDLKKETLANFNLKNGSYYSSDDGKYVVGIKKFFCEDTFGLHFDACNRMITFWYNGNYIGCQQLQHEEQINSTSTLYFVVLVKSTYGIVPTYIKLHTEAQHPQKYNSTYDISPYMNYQRQQNYSMMMGHRSRMMEVEDNNNNQQAMITERKCIVNAVWKRNLESRGSSWNVRSAIIVDKDLLIVGATNESDENQLYICDIMNMEWSGATLNGIGPGFSEFYRSITSEENDRLFVFWKTEQKGLIAKVKQAYEDNGFFVGKGETIVVLDNNDLSEDFVRCITLDDRSGIIPCSNIEIEEENNNFDSNTHSKLELSVLNFIADMQWTLMSCYGFELPKARKDFSCVRSDHRIFLFGGITDTGDLQNDTYTLDVEEFKWSLCYCGVESKPSPRFGHSATLLEPSYMIVFGGKGGDNLYFNDLYLFNTESLEWSQVEIENAPMPRAYHTMTQCKDNLILFGGLNEKGSLNDLHILNIERSTWLEINIFGDIPTGRFNHFCGYCEEKNSLIYFAGSDGKESLFDIYSLEINEEEKIENPKEEKKVIQVIEEKLEAQEIPELDNQALEIPKEYDLEPIDIEEKDKIISEEVKELNWSSPLSSGSNEVELTTIEFGGMTLTSPEKQFKVEDHIDNNNNSELITVNFSGHTFTLDQTTPKQKSFPTSQLFTPTTAIRPSEFFVEEKDSLEDIFSFISKGNTFISLYSMLRVCRDCKLTQNWLCWDSILHTIGEILNIDEITSKEQISFIQFKQIINELTIKRFKRNNGDVSSIHHLQLLETDIKPHYKNTIVEDEVLQQLYTPSSLIVFLKKKQYLQEIFAIYSSSVNINAINNIKEIMKSNNTISLAEFLAFCDNFELSPDKISKNVLQKIIYPACLLPEVEKDRLEDSKNWGLNYTRFLEALGRVAIYIYSKYPYSGIVKSTKEKIELLFKDIGLNDEARYKIFLKKLGIFEGQILSTKKPNTPKTPKTPTSTNITSINATKTKSEVQAKFIELIQDKFALREELQKIFMFYCAYGDRLNLDLMSSAKFKMFVKDINIYNYGLKQEDIDLIYIKTLVNKSKVKPITASAKQKMSFPQFVDCLKEISQKLRRDLASSKAFAQFLVVDVLPNAQRLNSFDSIDKNNATLQRLLEQNRKNLQKLFILYCNNSEQSNNNAIHETMGLAELTKFISDFDFSTTISKKDIYRIFRSTTTSLNNSLDHEIGYTTFEECLVKFAQIAYSKHPYDKKYPTIVEKVIAFMEKIEANDWNLIKKRLEKYGKLIPSFSFSTTLQSNNSNSLRQTIRGNYLENVSFETLSQKVASPQNLSPPNYSYIQLEPFNSLPKEQELDRLLKKVFFHHSEKNQFIKSNQFVRICSNSQIIDFNFTRAKAELIFVEITNSSQTPMNYDIFCESLALLSHRKYPSREDTTESLKKLLLNHVLPYGKYLEENK
ncbi:hypothetical protein ABK040_008269 [Willaertia magna]